VRAQARHRGVGVSAGDLELHVVIEFLETGIAANFRLSRPEEPSQRPLQIGPLHQLSSSQSSIARPRSSKCSRTTTTAGTENDHRGPLIACDSRKPLRNIADLTARLGHSVWSLVIQNRGGDPLRRLGTGRQAVEHVHSDQSSAELTS
jgi:hypothetical protein